MEVARIFESDAAELGETEKTFELKRSGREVSCRAGCGARSVGVGVKPNIDGIDAHGVATGIKSGDGGLGFERSIEKSFTRWLSRKFESCPRAGYDRYGS